MKIMRLPALINPASKAGHVVLSSIPTAWDIRRTRARQLTWADFAIRR